MSIAVDALITAPKRATLSTRETEVVELAALGMTNAQIGRRLGITTYAVKFHLASIYRKLGVANRTEAAVEYLKREIKD